MDGVALSQNKSTAVVVTVGIEHRLPHVGVTATAHGTPAGLPRRHLAVIVEVDRVRMFMTCTVYTLQIASTLSADAAWYSTV